MSSTNFTKSYDKGDNIEDSSPGRLSTSSPCWTQPHRHGNHGGGDGTHSPTSPPPPCPARPAAPQQQQQQQQQHHHRRHRRRRSASRRHHAAAARMPSLHISSGYDAEDESFPVKSRSMSFESPDTSLALATLPIRNVARQTLSPTKTVITVDSANFRHQRLPKFDNFINISVLPQGRNKETNENNQNVGRFKLSHNFWTPGHQGQRSSQIKKFKAAMRSKLKDQFYNNFRRNKYSDPFYDFRLEMISIKSSGSQLSSIVRAKRSVSAPVETQDIHKTYLENRRNSDDIRYYGSPTDPPEFFRENKPSCTTVTSDRSCPYADDETHPLHCKNPPCRMKGGGDAIEERNNVKTTCSERADDGKQKEGKEHESKRKKTKSDGKLKLAKLIAKNRVKSVAASETNTATSLVNKEESAKVSPVRNPKPKVGPDIQIPPPNYEYPDIVQLFGKKRSKSYKKPEIIAPEVTTDEKVRNIKKHRKSRSFSCRDVGVSTWQDTRDVEIQTLESFLRSEFEEHRDRFRKGLKNLASKLFEHDDDSEPQEDNKHTKKRSVCFELPIPTVPEWFHYDFLSPIRGAFAMFPLMEFAPSAYLRLPIPPMMPLPSFHTENKSRKPSGAPKEKSAQEIILGKESKIISDNTNGLQWSSMAQLLSFLLGLHRSHDKEKRGSFRNLTKPAVRRGVSAAAVQTDAIPVPKVEPFSSRSETAIAISSKPEKNSGNTDSAKKNAFTMHKSVNTDPFKCDCSKDKEHDPEEIDKLFDKINKRKHNLKLFKDKEYNGWVLSEICPDCKRQGLEEPQKSDSVLPKPETMESAINLLKTVYGSCMELVQGEGLQIDAHSKMRNKESSVDIAIQDDDSVRKPSPIIKNRIVHEGLLTDKRKRRRHLKFNESAKDKKVSKGAKADQKSREENEESDLIPKNKYSYARKFVILTSNVAKNTPRKCPVCDKLWNKGLGCLTARVGKKLCKSCEYPHCHGEKSNQTPRVDLCPEPPASQFWEETEHDPELFRRPSNISLMSGVSAPPDVFGTTKDQKLASGAKKDSRRKDIKKPIFINA